MLVLASQPRAPCASSISALWVPRGVIGRIRSVLSRIMGWTGATPRPPDDSRLRTPDVAVPDRDDVALTAHDCLTLLAIMVRCADAMRHPEAEDDFLEFHRAADRMDRLAQQLISPRQTEIETPEPIDLSQLVAQFEGMLKRAVAPGVSLRLQLGAFHGARIRARRWDLERILLYVVINAARGMASGGVVVIETSPPAGVRPSVSLIVSGSATAPPSSARIIPRSSASRQDDSDLGLAAVARLVQRLHGVLQFESDSERRTRIQVDFPLAIGDSQDHPV
jgi:C4-dicarboxylate-specific signal transduction histidine kinase